ncbi:MAG: thermonuclease family protein [Candidatus Kapaibacteriota bacterium]
MEFVQKYLSVFKFFLLLIVLVLLSRCSDNPNTVSDPNTPTEPWMQTRVIDISDGDTFSIYYKNQRWKVRVLYVDCFEVTKGTRLAEQASRAGISIDSALALGLEAKNFAKKILLNKKVELIRDYKEPNLDVYGRLLRIAVVDGMRYDSLIKAKGLAAPDK